MTETAGERRESFRLGTLTRPRDPTSPGSSKNASFTLFCAHQRHLATYSLLLPLTDLILVLYPPPPPVRTLISVQTTPQNTNNRSKTSFTSTTERHQDSLMRKYPLSTADFFLSSVVAAPAVFVSHAWSADPIATAYALRLHAMISPWPLLKTLVLLALGFLAGSFIFTPGLCIGT